jgi:hypothetical protein
MTGPVFPRKATAEREERLRRDVVGCLVILGGLTIIAACIIAVTWLIVSNL